MQYVRDNINHDQHRRHLSISEINNKHSYNIFKNTQFIKEYINYSKQTVSGILKNTLLHRYFFLQ